MNFVEQCNGIFAQAVREYHKTDHVDTPIANPYSAGTIEHDLYLKNCSIHLGSISYLSIASL